MPATKSTLRRKDLRGRSVDAVEDAPGGEGGRVVGTAGEDYVDCGIGFEDLEEGFHSHLCDYDI